MLFLLCCFAFTLAKEVCERMMERGTSEWLKAFALRLWETLLSCERCDAISASLGLFLFLSEMTNRKTL